MQKHPNDVSGQTLRRSLVPLSGYQAAAQDYLAKFAETFGGVPLQVSNAPRAYGGRCCGTERARAGGKCPA